MQFMIKTSKRERKKLKSTSSDGFTGKSIIIALEVLANTIS